MTQSFRQLVFGDGRDDYIVTCGIKSKNHLVELTATLLGSLLLGGSWLLREGEEGDENEQSDGHRGMPSMESHWASGLEGVSMPHPIRHRFRGPGGK